MQKSSFKVVAIVSLFFFLATPGLALAERSCPGGNCGAGSKNTAGSQNTAGGLGGIDPIMLALLMGGGLGGRSGGLGGGGGGGGGPAGQVGQVLTLVGALTGNMGLLIAGMITSMIGGMGGSTPQKGNVDERYVGQGQGYGNGGGGNPYYPTPTPVAFSPVPIAAPCASSVFIVNDTTLKPGGTKPLPVTRPYPAALSIAQNECVLAINSDTVTHTVIIKKGDTATPIDENIAASGSHIFRFPTKNTYKLCVGEAPACTTITVQ